MVNPLRGNYIGDTSEKWTKTPFGSKIAAGFRENSSVIFYWHHRMNKK